MDEQNPGTIDIEARLRERLQGYIIPLLELCSFAENQKNNAAFPCRSFLRSLQMETSRIQELIDGYGVQKNKEWFPFRETVAGGKTFSSTYYNLLHVREASSRYTLMDIKEDFSAVTEEILLSLRQSIFTFCGELEKQAKLRGVYPKTIEPDFEPCDEELMPFRFPENRIVRHVDKVGESVVYLATQVLNLSEKAIVKELLRQRQPEQFESCIPELVNEEKCRLVEANFHNLQSMYDTYLFESDLENQNKDLRYLRGHVSIIFHLLKMGTDLIHYYIRHMSKLRRESYAKLRFPLPKDAMLTAIFDYFLHYAGLYLEAAKQLCRSMIQHYSVETEVHVRIPNYRGFHVRPSTLIARIVAHYGSNIKMFLDDEEYDAGIPFDLFRANEEINARKRRYIADKMNNRRELQVQPPNDIEDLKKDLLILFLNMMSMRELILYDSDLPFDDLSREQQENLAALASRYIKHFMSIAKIDVRSDITIAFRGDNRALHDIELLAENGYGEDEYGNNIELPPELAYLRE